MRIRGDLPAPVCAGGQTGLLESAASLADPGVPRHGAFWRPWMGWAEVWKMPLHDFPIRDEILYQFFPWASGADVLEIGPGCGFTAFWLSRWVRRLALVDVAEEPLEELRVALDSLSNVRCACWDLSQPGLAEKLDEDFDAAFGLDVLEYVAYPTTCLQNLATVLRPGGLLLLSFPNVPPPRGDGVTYFRGLDDLACLLRTSGFRRWEVFGVRPRSDAAFLYRSLHEWPLALVRAWRANGQTGRPQTYNATWFFRHREQLRWTRALLSLYWAVLGSAMRLGSDIFVREAVTDQILGRQLVVRAWR